ncbi:Di-/tripeptide transporter [Bacillus cereus Rock4-18]|nr:Di-/tripeptide transporter [Bacillus cereus Rock4-18]
MDLLLNVMYMKKTAEIPQQSFFIPLLYYIHITALTAES